MILKSNKISLILILLFLFIVPLIKAEEVSTISDALDYLIENFRESNDVYIIVGRNAHMDDFDSADIIGLLFTDKFQGKVYPNKTTGWERDPVTRKDSQILKEPYPNKMILIGGPCANEYVPLIFNEKCEDWRLKKGQSSVKLLKQGNKIYLLVAGTLKGDTKDTAEKLKNYRYNNDFKTSAEVMLTQAITSECGNNICEQLETDESCRNDCPTENSKPIIESKYAYNSQVYENTIVWIENNNKITIYDASLQKVVREIDVFQPSSLDIYGNYIVWFGSKGEETTSSGRVDVIGTGVYLYNILTGQEKLIDAKGSFNSMWSATVDIYENKIVWDKPSEDEQYGVIYIYDISIGTKEKITTKKIGETYPKIWGNKIIYIEEQELNNQFITVYDINTNTKTTITDLPKKAIGKFSVHNNKIVWFDRIDQDLYMYIYDLSTNQKLRIRSDNLKQTSPSIYKNTIIWEDYRNENADIYMCDLTKNGQKGGCLEDDEKIRITTNAKNQNNPEIYRDKIIWLDHRDITTSITGTPRVEGEVATIGGPEEGSKVYMYIIKTEESRTPLEETTTLKEETTTNIIGQVIKFFKSK